MATLVERRGLAEAERRLPQHQLAAAQILAGDQLQALATENGTDGGVMHPVPVAAAVQQAANKTTTTTTNDVV